MSRIINLSLAILTMFSFEAFAENKVHKRRTAATFTVELINKKRTYDVGEQWVGEFRATATSGTDRSMTIRAWSRFFADYEVVPDIHGAIEDSKLSDVLATGGQIWREGVPVVLWNTPSNEIFGESFSHYSPTRKECYHNFFPSFWQWKKIRSYASKDLVCNRYRTEPRDVYVTLRSRTNGC